MVLSPDAEGGVVRTVLPAANSGIPDVDKPYGLRLKKPRSLDDAAELPTLLAGVGGQLLSLDLSDMTSSLYAGSSTTMGFVEGPKSAARFNKIRDIALGCDGLIYVADEKNHCIRKVDPGPEGDVSTLAGTPRRAGTGSAELYWPVGLCTDGYGQLYVGDCGNKRVGKVETFGELSTLDLQSVPPAQCCPRYLEVTQGGNLAVLWYHLTGLPAQLHIYGLGLKPPVRHSSNKAAAPAADILSQDMRRLMGSAEHAAADLLLKVSVRLIS